MLEILFISILTDIHANFVNDNNKTCINECFTKILIISEILYVKQEYINNNIEKPYCSHSSTK
jgi:hypothetical protein